MTLAELTKNLADRVRQPAGRRSNIEAFSARGGLDLCTRYDNASHVVEMQLEDGNGEFEERDLIYLRLRSIEEGCALSTRYDAENPGNKDWPIVYHPNNLARLFLKTYGDREHDFSELPDIEDALCMVLDVTYTRLRKDHPWIVGFLEKTRLARLWGPEDSSRYP